MHDRLPYFCATSESCSCIKNKWINKLDANQLGNTHINWPRALAEERTIHSIYSTFRKDIVSSLRRFNVSKVLIANEWMSGWGTLWRLSWSTERVIIPIRAKGKWPPGEGGGGCTPQHFGWGCAARFSKPWPYFRPKYMIFQTPFQTWPENL